MHNIRLLIAYDGKNFLGWQKNNTGPSIEEVLEKVLFQIFQTNVPLQAASRTDAGVHARGQVVNFILPHERFSLSQLQTSLNSLLPKDLAILEISRVPDHFHPTIDCISKEYHYSVCYGTIQLPQFRLFSWHYPYPLDIDKMKQAIKHLVGVHDFSAFCNLKPDEKYEHHVRHLHSIDIIQISDKQLKFIVIGNHFLYKMVRNLVGTLVYVGCGKIGVDDIPGILASKDRKRAGMTAPAHGLFLHKINYREEVT